MEEPKEITEFRERLEIAMRKLFFEDGTPCFTERDSERERSMSQGMIEYYIRCRISPEIYAENISELHIP